MSIWNKILLGLIGLASVFFFYMAARAVKTQTAWSELAEKYQRRIAQVQAENLVLQEGAEAKEGAAAEDGIRQLALKLNRLVVDRRRMWTNCAAVVKTGKDDAEATVTIEQPTPHGIAKSTVVEAFEELPTEKKGVYLGQFAAVNVGDKQVTLASTTKLDAREIEKLKKAKSPWVLYEVMPADNRAVFAMMPDDRKKAMLPADTVQEYLKDGRPAAADDPAEMKDAEGRFVRPLRDYRVQFDAERAQRVLLSDSIEMARRDKPLIESALAEARTQEEAGKRDVAAADEALKSAGHKRDILLAHRQNLEKKLAAMRAYIAQLAETNQAMAGQIAKFQLEAVRRIDQRTRAMAQSGSGRP